MVISHTCEGLPWKKLSSMLEQLLKSLDVPAEELLRYTKETTKWGKVGPVHHLFWFSGG